MNPFYLLVDKNGFYMKKDTFGNHFLCMWLIRNSTFQNACREKRLHGLHVKMSVSQEEIKISLECYGVGSVLKCVVTLSTDTGKVLFDEIFDLSYQLEGTVSVAGEKFQELKKLPNDAFVLSCRVKCNLLLEDRQIKTISMNIAMDKTEYLKKLEADIKKYPGAFSKQRISLRVGKLEVVVNKAVLCARSSVFAKMFGTRMREQEENTVIVTDIEIPVLEALVSFLYTGVLPDRMFDFDFLCGLYYAADKYNIEELHQVCIGYLLREISLQNIFRVFKLSLLHNDEQLKTLVMALISANIDKLSLTSDYKNLMDDDPAVILKASTFFGF